MKSTMWVKRVVLVNGQKSGKGRPGRDVKKSRTCLYIPLKESFGSHTRATSERPYNPSKNPDQRKQFKRTNLSALKPIVVESLSQPVVSVNESPAIESVAPEAAPAAAVENPETITA